VGSKLTAKTQSSPSPRATDSEKGFGSQHRFASEETPQTVPEFMLKLHSSSLLP